MRGWLLRVGILLGGILMGWESSVQSQPVGEPIADEPPPLTLERIFHPQNRYAYVSPLPKAKWVLASPKSLLVVQRDKKWFVADPGTGEETEWDYPQKLADSIGHIDGVNETQIKAAVNRSIESMESMDRTVLVRIGDALAIVPPGQPARLLTRDAKSWLDATLDPSRRRVAYTTDGDLFVVDIASGRTHRLTDDASPTVLDGRLDWTYQEEIFGRGNYKGFRFSPDGNFLAMLRIDISDIAPYTLGDSQQDRGSGLVRRYSKAGDPIPHAELYMWDLRRLDEGIWPPPRLLAKSTPQEPQIVTGMWWHEHATRFLYSISNRKQTWREIRYVDADYLTGNSNNQKRWLREDSPAWIEPPGQPAFLRDGGIVWRSNLPTGRSRLYWLGPAGKTVAPITPADFDVRDFFVDDRGTFAIVTGGDQGDTTEQHVYVVDLRASQQAAVSQGSLPELRKLTNASEGWHTVTPDATGHTLLIRHSSANQPTKLIVQKLARAAEDSLVRAAESKVDETESPKDASKKSSATLELARSVMDLPGGWIPREKFRIQAPDGFKLPAALKRAPLATQENPGPVVIQIYGGPRISIVQDRWNGNRGLQEELLARDGISTLTVDNRSSGGRGIADTWSVRGKLGEVEFGDVSAAVDWLRQQKWVDPNRIAIQGWSFGGYLTLYSMTHSDAFVAGIAGGSVTDWREYDSFYTERYMGLPQENEEGYATQSLLKDAERMTGRVLLIHGELDDNVHPSNTLRMAEALQNAGKQFDLMIYPGAAHSVRDPQQAWHLARMTDEFLRRHLLDGKKSPESPIE